MAGPSNGSNTTLPSTAAVQDELNDEGVDYGEDEDDDPDRDGRGRGATATTTTGAEMTDEDRELEAMKARVREMEAEAAKLREMQAVAEKEMAARLGTPASSDAAAAAAGAGAPAHLSEEEKQAIDGRSIFVGNVDFSATPEDLYAHFSSCGALNRVTILCDKHTGQPKGYAYVEFASEESVQNAMTLNESMFKDRAIKVTPKRTNVPHFMLPGSRGRGRGGFRGARGGGRASYNPYSRPPRSRGRGRGRGGY